MEFKIPKRFCLWHGVEMRPSHIRREYNSQTGAIEDMVQNYKCPKWWCNHTVLVKIVVAGKVLIP